MDEKKRLSFDWPASVELWVAWCVSALSIWLAQSHLELAWLLWVVWVPWLWVLRCVRQHNAWFLLGSLGLGLMWYGRHLAWLAESLMVKTPLEPLPALAWTLGACALMSVFPALVLVALRIAELSGTNSLPWFPPALVLMELGLQWLPLGGVPWVEGAVFLPESWWPWLGLNIIGSSGWTLLAGACASFLVWWATRYVQAEERGCFQAGWAMACLGMVWLGLLTSNHFFSHQSDLDKALAAQVLVVPTHRTIPELNQTGFTAPLLSQLKTTTASHLRNARPDWVIWPESAYPGIVEAGKTLVELHEWTKHKSFNLILGANAKTLHSQGWKHHNAAYWVRPEFFAVNRYDKRKLVPFGEHTPTWLQPLMTHKLFPQIRELSAGDRPVVFGAGGHNPGVLICFESLFSGLLAELQQQGAGWLVVLSNSQWMNKHATLHHLKMSRLRAFEAGLSLVMVNNGGPSMVYDAINNRTQLFDAPRLVRLNSHPGSPYSAYGRWAMGLLMLAWLLGGWLPPLKARFSQSTL